MPNQDRNKAPLNASLAMKDPVEEQALEDILSGRDSSSKVVILPGDGDKASASLYKSERADAERNYISRQGLPKTGNGLTVYGDETGGTVTSVRRMSGKPPEVTIYKPYTVGGDELDPGLPQHYTKLGPEETRAEVALAKAAAAAIARGLGEATWSCPEYGVDEPRPTHPHNQAASKVAAEIHNSHTKTGPSSKSVIPSF